MLHDSILEFLQREYREGFLLANPDVFCTGLFLQHLVEFIEAQAGARCPRCDAVASEYARQVDNLQRWIRWLLPRRRGGGR
jgi:hypothetical protein